MNRKFYLFLTVLLFSSYNSFSQGAQEVMKVMTYNIWNGFDWGKDRERKEECLKWIKSKQPDVLALQELCGYTEEMLKEDAKEWGHPYVKILKTEGYPVGITSRQPILVKDRIVEGFWHGLLHCETYGIDFYIVHLSPADSDFRLREANLIAEKIQQQGNSKYVILGDFNSHSPFDEVLLKQNAILLKKQQPKKGDKYSNLRLGAFDYAVISRFISLPAIDVTNNFIPVEARYTFPTPALIKPDFTKEEIIQQRQRIDYIFTSPLMSRSCVNAEVFNSGITDKLSDHYPVMASFKLKKE
ncbi:endonuclease/exonuclease/phosphatase family protein [Zhouia spongiae]|uniref:Endonuclease/exonuclease/phosphatase family protein n=1 Tax=Zhouia spongiae TaxID=2202721 RepID=A0ABY3YLM9_9FLAO|nr:endonuclease/exonuclease/phosphatase family protein [Zhouia spongiae]UNY98744.1 endonuclease/exonuclease/phosphatase family protein [Zhouia spongiae]